MRSSPRNRLSGLGLAVCGLVALLGSGCNMLAAMGYIAHEDNTEAEFKKLSGKRVAVVCRPIEQLKFSDTQAAPELAAAVSSLISKNVKHCNLVSSSEVAEWADTYDWREFSEVGKAVKADYVVGIDLEQFSLNEGQTLYKGRAVIHIYVYDIKNGGQKVWDKQLPPPEVVWPPNSAVANTDRLESEFRRQYISVLADHIARNFYPHDPRADFASDTNVLN